MLKLKGVSNYKRCRGSLGAGRLCDFSRAEERRQRVLADRLIRHSLRGMKPLPLCAADQLGAGGIALRPGLPVAQGPSHILPSWIRKLNLGGRGIRR